MESSRTMSTILVLRATSFRTDYVLVTRSLDVIVEAREAADILNARDGTMSHKSLHSTFIAYDRDSTSM